MAGLAIVRALSFEDQPEVKRKRIPSALLIDQMKPIPEDGMPTSSPYPKRKRMSFQYGGQVDPAETSCLLPRDRELAQEPSGDGLGLNIFLSTMAVFSMVSQTVATPVYTAAMSNIHAGSDAFIASFAANLWTPIIFFTLHAVFNVRHSFREIFALPAPWQDILLAGVLAGLNSILTAFTSLPERVPPYLQAILHHLLIPFTAFARYIVIGKGITKLQLMCVFIVFVGMIITLEPSMFGMREIGIRYTARPSYTHVWYFYVVYGLAWLPMAFGIVLMEKGLKQYESHSLSYIAWLQLFVVFAHFIFFWIDFIPNLGMADVGNSNFLEKMWNGFGCFYGQRSGCSGVPQLAVFYLVSTACITVFFALLVKIAEGAVFTVVVLALATPLSALFWNLFAVTPEFHYEPFFDLATGFVFVGLVIMMPGVVMYTYLGRMNNPNLGPEKVQHICEEELPLRYRQELVTLKPRRTKSLGFIVTEAKPPLAPPPSPTLATTVPKKKKKGMRRARSAPVLMGGF